MTKPLTTKTYRYVPSTHAVDQVNVRFGVDRPAVTEWLNAEMRSTTYIVTQPNGAMVYETKDARIVVDKGGSTIITVTPLQADLPVHDKVRALVERQLRLAEAAHARSLRKINIEIARRDVEVAQLRLNQQRVNNPATKAHIERKLSLVEASISRLRLDVRRADEVLDTERRAARMYGIK